MAALRLSTVPGMGMSTCSVGPSQPGGRQAVLLAAHHHRDGSGEVGLPVGLGRGGGGGHGADAPAVQPGDGAGRVGHRQRQGEEGAQRGAHHVGVEGVGGRVADDERGGPGRLGGAHHRAQVPRLLDALHHQQQGSGARGRGGRGRWGTGGPRRAGPRGGRGRRPCGRGPRPPRRSRRRGPRAASTRAASFSPRYRAGQHHTSASETPPVQGPAQLAVALDQEEAAAVALPAIAQADQALEARVGGAGDRLGGAGHGLTVAGRRPRRECGSGLLGCPIPGRAPSMIYRGGSSTSIGRRRGSSRAQRTLGGAARVERGRRGLRGLRRRPAHARRPGVRRRADRRRPGALQLAQLPSHRRPTPAGAGHRGPHRLLRSRVRGAGDRWTPTTSNEELRASPARSAPGLRPGGAFRLHGLGADRRGPRCCPCRWRPSPTGSTSTDEFLNPPFDPDGRFHMPVPVGHDRDRTGPGGPAGGAARVLGPDLRPGGELGLRREDQPARRRPRDPRRRPPAPGLLAQQHRRGRDPRGRASCSPNWCAGGMSPFFDSGRLRRAPGSG